MHVRRLQQILTKKTGFSTSADMRNATTGQLSGASRVARISDEEIYALGATACDAVAQELLGPRADNLGKSLQMYRNIERDGRVSYADLEGDSDSQGTLQYFNVTMLAAGLHTDLVDDTELLRITTEKPSDPALSK